MKQRRGWVDKLQKRHARYAELGHRNVSVEQGLAIVGILLAGGVAYVAARPLFQHFVGRTSILAQVAPLLAGASIWWLIRIFMKRSEPTP